MDFLSTRYEDLSKAVGEMTKKDEIAEAVAVRMQQNRGRRWTVREKVLAAAVALCTLVGIWTEIAIQLSSGST